MAKSGGNPQCGLRRYYLTKIIGIYKSDRFRHLFADSNASRIGKPASLRHDTEFALTHIQKPPPVSSGRLTITERPGQESMAEILRQAMLGFLPPADALSNLFDRMEMPR